MPEQLSFAGLGTTRSRAHGLFFSALPDRAAATRMTRLAWSQHREHGFQRDPIKPDRLHISLLGLGTYVRLPPDMVAWAREAATAVAMAPFDVELDRVASFAGKPGGLPLVLFGSSGVAALKALQLALVTAIRKVRIHPWQLQDFTPHVTLLYGGRYVDARAVAAIGWQVREFVLVHSVQGGHEHILLGRWPLRGCPPAGSEEGSAPSAPNPLPDP